MATRMVHEVHGVLTAVGSEIAWNEANGWKIDPGPDKMLPVEEEVEEGPKKRGPKPKK